jgi:quinol monooxygenase YgiN
MRGTGHCARFGGVRWLVWVAETMSFSCPGGLSQRNSPAGWTRRRQDWTVEPQQRESYLAGCVRIVEQARRAVGPDVAICADLVDPGRVNIFERWESQAALETFRSSGPDTEQRLAMLTVSVQEYDIADVRAVFGEGAE